MAVSGAALLLAGWMAAAQPGARSNRGPLPIGFHTGETLRYDVRWKPVFMLPSIHAGDMTLRVSALEEFRGRKAYRVQVEAISTGLLPKMAGIEVRNFYESIFDAETLCSLRLVKRTREGDRKRDVELDIDPDGGTSAFVEYDSGVAPRKLIRRETFSNQPRCAIDIVSSFYVARTLDFKTGSTQKLILNDDGVIRELSVAVPRMEVVAAAERKFQTFQIETRSGLGGMFKDKGAFTVWYATDSGRIPVRFEAKVAIGRVFGRLVKVG